MNFLSKLKFILKKPKMIIITGEGRKYTKKSIFQVLSRHPRAGRNVLISESDLKNPQDIEELKFLINKSSLFILVLNHAADSLSDLPKMMSAGGWIVLNFDDETVRETDGVAIKTLTFGFKEGADFRATDINVSGRDASSASVAGEPVLGTNFKINHKGNTVPVWLEGTCGKEQIYSALAAACVATIFDLNLIEISQALKNYHF